MNINGDLKRIKTKTPLQKEVAGINALNIILKIVAKHFKSDIYYNPQIIYRGLTKDYEECNLTGEWYVRSSLSVRFRQTIDQLYRPQIDKKTNEIEHKSISKRQKKIEITKFKQDLYAKHIKKAEYLDQILTLISDAKRRHPERYSKMTDLEVLSDLQHNGGATCLVDFSKNILTSLWFACNGDLNDDGYLICYNTTEDIIVNNSLTKLTPKDINCPIQELLLKTYRLIDVCSVVNNRFCLWEPMSINNRISRQDSVFIFGIEQFKISNMSNNTVLLIQIPKKLKVIICELLENRFGINSATIYNDYVGYAVSNDKRNILYREQCNRYDLHYPKGFEALVHGNYKEALELLNSIPKNQELTIERQIELSFSRAICYKNRGLGYAQNAMIAYQDVIKKAKKILKQKTYFSQKSSYEYYLRKIFRAYNDMVNICYLTKNWDKGDDICTEILTFIDKKIIKCVQNTPKNNNSRKEEVLCNNCHFKNPTQKEDTKDNCFIRKVSKRSTTMIRIEFLMLKLLSEKYLFANKDLRNKILESCKTIQDTTVTECSEFKFYDKLLAEYYKAVINAIFNNNSKKQDFQKRMALCIPKTYIAEEDGKTNSSQLKSENNEIGFYYWNFEDMKQAINNLTPKQLSNKKKAILQLLTTKIIEAKDIVQSINYNLYYKI